jgi:hypothetical protein
MEVYIPFLARSAHSQTAGLCGEKIDRLEILYMCRSAVRDDAAASEHRNDIPSGQAALVASVILEFTTVICDRKSSILKCISRQFS